MPMESAFERTFLLSYIPQDKAFLAQLPEKQRSSGIKVGYDKDIAEGKIL